MGCGPRTVRKRSLNRRSAMLRALRLCLVASVVLVAAIGCGGGNPLQVRDGSATAGHGGGNGGSSGAGASAAALDGGPPQGSCAALDETSCSDRMDCQSQSCPDCRGGATFAACATLGGSIACPAEACVAAGPCDSLDEASCTTRSDCKPSYCPDCDGGQRFGLCAGPNEGAACLGCPAPTTCDGLDETTCTVTSGCQTFYCPSCDGGQTFAGCSSATFGGVGCPAACSAPPSCGGLDGTSCDARSDCHAVFAICDCADAGCCTPGFERCADGPNATCSGAPACQVAPPNCGPLLVASHNVMCFDGCVRPTQCAP